MQRLFTILLLAAPVMATASLDGSNTLISVDYISGEKLSHKTANHADMDTERQQIIRAKRASVGKQVEHYMAEKLTATYRAKHPALPEQFQAAFGLGYANAENNNVFQYEYEALNLYLGAQSRPSAATTVEAWARMASPGSKSQGMDAGVKMQYRIRQNVSAHGLMIYTNSDNFDEPSSFCFHTCGAEGHAVSVGAGIDIRFK